MGIRFKGISFLFLTGILSFQAHATEAEQKCIQVSTTIEQKLSCIEGLQFTEEKNTVGLPAGLRQFELKFIQPIDHKNPQGGTFSQRLVLVHRSETEPMVLQTSGYSIFGVRLSAIASVFQTNQIQVEHRFFSDSVPTPLDWTKHNIKQSADDFHRVTVALKQIYPTRWVNTGGSKGGMTSVYHRRFYPKDLDGTVADVAPLSFSTSDERYITFVENVGGENFKECREKLKYLQVKLLENRAVLVPKIAGEFAQLGSADVAFEHAVIESSFIFWQYGNPYDSGVGCQAIPVNGTPEQMFSFLDRINPMSGYKDSDLANFIPYYFQAATQLGNPGNSTKHLDHLRRYAFTIDQYVPKDLKYTYTPTAMHDVAYWVKTKSRGIIFVYGELDPWSAGEFPVNEKGRDTYKYFVAGGNHGAKFTALAAKEKSEVMATLSRWFNKQPPVISSSRMDQLSSQVDGFEIPKKQNTEMYLEDLEFQARRRNRL